MTEKNIGTRIQHKHDIEANWDRAVNFIPKAGELIIYDADTNFDRARVKIGDGATTVSALPFVVTKINTDDVLHKETNELLSVILETYILEIDYNTILSFNTTEIVFGSGATTAKLGVALLGSMVLGQT